MQVPPEVVFKDVSRTPEVEDLINKHIAKLEKVCDYIISLSVVVERGAQSHKSGNPFYVRLDIRIPPGHELVGKRVSYTGTWEEPLPAVIRRTFERAQRQLQRLVAEQRKKVKAHPNSSTMAFVTRVFRNEGYGFITNLDGEDIYFHKNSVLHNHWDKITLGSGVRYEVEMGEKGPQATTVEVVQKPGAAEIHGTLHAV